MNISGTRIICQFLKNFEDIITHTNFLKRQILGYFGFVETPSVCSRWPQSGAHQGHGFPPGIAMTAPAQGGGGGGRRPGGVGAMRNVDLRELETGEGVSPSPSAPPPMAIATTVHCMKTRPRKRPSQGQAWSGTSPLRVRMKIRIGFQQSGYFRSSLPGIQRTILTPSPSETHAPKSPRPRPRTAQAS